MTGLHLCRSFSRLLAVSLLGMGMCSRCVAAEHVGVVEVSRTVLVFSTAAGNLVASVGPDGALLVGTPSAQSTAEIGRILANRTKSSLRYVVITAEDPNHSEGDAGWGRRGAFVAMQENALQRIGGDVMGAPPALSERFIKLGVERPRIAFSEVLGFDLNGESVHVVHLPPGYSNADTIVHFHVANLVYFGEVFPGDGYPKIDAAQGGTLSGLLKILSSWTDSKFRVVPARGKIMNGEDVKAFVNMINTVRDRIQRLINTGHNENRVLAQHVTSDFDSTWGHGRVAPDDFVREIYADLTERP